MPIQEVSVLESLEIDAIRTCFYIRIQPLTSTDKAVQFKEDNA